MSSFTLENLKPGTKMPDGTVYAGDLNGKPMYTTPKDAPLTYTFEEAAEYAWKLDAHGHNDWRVPTKDELSVLFQNRAAIGGFNETGHINRGWYCLSSRVGINDTQPIRRSAWALRFSDGNQDTLNFRSLTSALRCVRG